MAFIDQHTLAIKTATQKLLREPLGTFITLFVIALSLAVPATLYRVADATRTMVSDESHRPMITLVLKDGIREDQVKSLKDTLMGRPDLRQVHFISPEEGLTALQSRLGTQDLMAGLESNPLPPVITVQTRSLNPEQLDQLANTLKGLSGVDHIKMDAEWAKRLHALTRFIDRGVLLLGMVLLLAALTVVVNTVRLQLSRAQEEIRVSKLIGASDSFVRRPFVYLGALEMGFGTAMALGLAELARTGFNVLSSQWLQPLGVQFVMPELTALDLSLGIGIAVLLGGVAASITTTLALGRLSKFD